MEGKWRERSDLSTYDFFGFDLLIANFFTMLLSLVSLQVFESVSDDRRTELFAE